MRARTERTAVCASLSAAAVAHRRGRSAPAGVAVVRRWSWRGSAAWGAIRGANGAQPSATQGTQAALESGGAAGTPGSPRLGPGGHRFKSCLPDPGDGPVNAGLLLASRSPARAAAVGLLSGDLPAVGELQGDLDAPCPTGEPDRLGELRAADDLVPLAVDGDDGAGDLQSRGDPQPDAQLGFALDAALGRGEPDERRELRQRPGPGGRRGSWRRRAATGGGRCSAAAAAGRRGRGRGRRGRRAARQDDLQLVGLVRLGAVVLLEPDRPCSSAARLGVDGVEVVIGAEPRQRPERGRRPVGAGRETSSAPDSMRRIATTNAPLSRSAATRGVCRVTPGGSKRVDASQVLEAAL